MFNREEMQMREAKKTYEQIKVPDQLDLVIEAGIQRGKKERIQKRRFTRSIIGLVATIMIVGFFTSIRVSPTFAATISKLPGFEYIVKLVNYDKGLQLAVENEFVQHIGVSDEHEDLVFTVEDIIVDESRMLVFYSIENKGDHKYVNIENIEIQDDAGNNLKAGLSYSSFLNEDMNITKKIHGTFDLVINQDTEFPDKVYLKVGLRESKEEGLQNEEPLQSIWNIPFTIDKAKFEGMKEEYTLNQTIEMEGQKIEFKKVTIYPTRIGIEVYFDPQNSKQIFNFDDLRLVDGKGEEWGTITNGISGSILSENHQILYFQSNYFKKPEELYLVGSSIRALDKDKRKVVVDIENEMLIKSPSSILTFEGVRTGYDQTPQAKGEEMVFHFVVNREDVTEAHKHHFSIFDYQVVDAAGKVYERTSEGTSMREDEKDGWKQYIEYHIPKDENIQSPLTFTISDFPTRIMGDFLVKIK